MWITLLGIHRTIGLRYYSAATAGLGYVVSPRISNAVVNDLLLRQSRARDIVSVERKVINRGFAVAVFNNCSGRRYHLAQLAQAVGNRPRVRLCRHAAAQPPVVCSNRSR